MMYYKGDYAGLCDGVGMVRRAAEQGYLGVLYDNGNGVEQDYTAAEW